MRAGVYSVDGGPWAVDVEWCSESSSLTGRCASSGPSCPLTISCSCRQPCLRLCMAIRGLWKSRRSRRKSIRSIRASQVDPNSVRAFLGFPETAKEARPFVPSSDHQMWRIHLFTIIILPVFFIYSITACMLEYSMRHPSLQRPPQILRVVHYVYRISLARPHRKTGPCLAAIIVQVFLFFFF